MRERSHQQSFLVFLLCVLPISVAHADLELPGPSPKARTEQRVGLTDFSIDYSSPGVKGRKIWGELVPYDKVWRAGANAPTQLKASRDFRFGDTAVKAGTYSVFVTPGKASWTVVLNSEASIQNDPKKDVAKVAVSPTVLTSSRERMLWSFSDTQDDRSSLDLEWERVRIRVPITTDTRAHVAAAIEKATDEAWGAHYDAAVYLSKTDPVRALAFVDKSIAIRSTWENEWMRAQLQLAKGNKSEAIAGSNRALARGKGDPDFEARVRAEIVQTVAGWK